MAIIKYTGEEALGRVAEYVNKKLTFASSMPESPDTDTVVLYVGASNSSYLKGGIYQYDGTNWKIINLVQQIELTQEEYEELPDEAKNNGTVYFITDMNIPGSIVSGYYNIEDEQFYNEDTYDTEMAANINVLYIDIPTNILYIYDMINEKYVQVSNKNSESTVIKYVNNLPYNNIENIIYAYKTVTNKYYIAAEGFLDNNNYFIKNNNIYTPNPNFQIQGSLDNKNYKDVFSIEDIEGDFRITYTDNFYDILPYKETLYCKIIDLSFYAGDAENQKCVLLSSTNLENYYTKAEVNNLLDGIEPTTFNGRSGSILPIAGDYNDSQIILSSVMHIGGETQTTVAETLSALSTQSNSFITDTVNNLVNYYTKLETYTKEEINNLISSIPKMNIAVVSSLPTTNISTTTIYLVPKSNTGTNNIKDEYINLTGTTTGWEIIGNTAIDLSGYATTAMIGNLSDLATTTKTNLVAAINEIKSGSNIEIPIPISKGGTGNTVGYIRTGQLSNFDPAYCATAEGASVIAKGRYSHAEGGGGNFTVNKQYWGRYHYSLAEIESLRVLQTVDMYYFSIEDLSISMQPTTVTTNIYAKILEPCEYLKANDIVTVPLIRNGNECGQLEILCRDSRSFSIHFYNFTLESSELSSITLYGDAYNISTTGDSLITIGDCSHAEGRLTKTFGNYSHAGGINTIATYEAQTTIGKYNDNKSTTLLEVGNGTSSTRSNALEVYNNGTIGATGGLGIKLKSDNTKAIKFGIDSNGNYGYYKDGADTVTPFKTGSGNLQTKTINVTPSANWSGANTNNATINPDSGYAGMSQVNVSVPMLRDHTLLTASSVETPSTVYNGDTSQSNSTKMLRLKPTKDGMSYTGSYLNLGPSSYMGNATAADVASGKTFSSENGIQITGTASGGTTMGEVVTMGEKGTIQSISDNGITVRGSGSNYNSTIAYFAWNTNVYQDGEEVWSTTDDFTSGTVTATKTGSVNISMPFKPTKIILVYEPEEQLVVYRQFWGTKTLVFKHFNAFPKEI